jgi:hypothetical protein
MAIDALNSIVALLLSISLAAERLVTILKTIWPTCLATEKKKETGEIDGLKDALRRLALQMIAIFACWITAAFLADGGLNMLGHIKVGSGTSSTSIPVFIVGLLSSGGSAFWNSLLGYTKAVKDARTIQAARERLEFNIRVEGLRKTQS